MARKSKHNHALAKGLDFLDSLEIETVEDKGGEVLPDLPKETQISNI